jgi:hypothetical protein
MCAASGGGATRRKESAAAAASAHSSSGPRAAAAAGFMVDWAGLVAPGSAQQLLRSVVVGWLARFAALVDLDVSAGFWPLGDPTTRATHPPYCYAGIPWCLNLMYSILLQFNFFVT